MLCPYCVSSPGMRTRESHILSLMPRGSAIPSQDSQGKEAPERGRDLKTW